MTKAGKKLIAAVLEARALLSEDKPVFEVRSPDDQVWKIYASGLTEGFPEGCTIFNRIPSHANRVAAKAMGKIEHRLKTRTI